MKNTFFILLLALGSESFAANLKYSTTVDLNDYKGQTYFSLMNEVIKPSLDEYANEGFKVANGRTAVAALKKVDSKVSAKALSAAGSAEKLKAVADAVSKKGNVTFYDLPAVLGEEGVGAGRFDLSTYLALVSGGGVAVKINEENIAYNVNYGTGANDKDERTGRSFGEAPGRMALDASDKHYLEILEHYVRTDGENTEFFFKSILEILLNSDAANFENISEEGQAVATDFLAVYTAEQDRHIMANLKSHPWDEALLEVTLLSALHSGQKKVTLMYNGEFTDTTLKQAPGCDTAERAAKKASLIDYWQFSSSTDPESCNRSGLNVTRKDFRKLGAAITAYQRENNPELLENVQRHFKTTKNKGNVFAQLSAFLINARTPAHLDKGTLELAEDFSALLMQIRTDANQTSQFITRDWNGEGTEE